MPNLGLPDEALGQYRAVLATTGYFDTAIEETESFEENLAEVRPANFASLGNAPLIVSRRRVRDPLPVSEDQNQQTWQSWQVMNSDMPELSTNGKHVITQQSGYSN